MREPQPPAVITVRLKLTAVLLVVLLILLGTIVLVGRLVIQPYLLERERIQVTEALTHGVDALQRENDHVAVLARDLMKSLRLGRDVFSGQLADFTSPGPGPAGHAALDAALLLNERGEVVKEQSFFSPQMSAFAPMEGFPGLDMDALRPALARGDCLQGLLPSPGGPLLTAICALGPGADQTGQGLFVAGFLVDDALLSRLSVQTGLRLELRTWPAAARGRGERPGRVETDITDDAAHGRILLAGPLGDPAYELSGPLIQRVAEKGRQAMRVGIMFILSTGIILVAALWLVIDHILLGPLRTLSQHIFRVAQSKDLTIRVAATGQDEMARLIAAFDLMLGELDQSRRALGRRSFGQGMAGMAAGLLHNVRNALSPLVARLHLLRERLGSPLLSQAAQAAAELADPALHPPREGESAREADLKRFLSLVLPEIGKGAKECQIELEELINLAAKTEGMLLNQDLASRGWMVRESVRLSDVCIEAQELIGASRLSGAAVELDHQLDSLGPVEADALNLQQVVANLLLNAAESVAATGAPGFIHIFARKPAPGTPPLPAPAEGAPSGDPAAPRQALELVIQDNGQGLAPGQIERLFTQGYSTKNRTGSGLGLHWCANAVAAMGGVILAESDGPGLGARLIIRLPKGTP